MRPRTFFRPPLLGAVFSALLLIAPGATAAKCVRIQDMPDLDPERPVIVVDGRIFLGDLDAVDVHSIEILCWNHETGRFEAAGIPLIFVLTNQHVSSARDPIEQLLDAQQAYHSSTSTYARTLADLQELADLEEAQIEFSASDSGWGASSRKTESSYHCLVFSGSIAPPIPAMVEGEILCEPDKSMTLQSLREWYDKSVGEAT